MSMGIQVCDSDGEVGDTYAQMLFMELDALQTLEDEHGCRLMSMLVIEDEPEMYPASELLRAVARAKELLNGSDAPALMSDRDSVISDLDGLQADLQKAADKNLEAGLVAC